MEYLYRTGLQSSMKRSTFQLLIKVFNNTNSKKMIKDVTSEIMFVLSFKEDVLALLTSCVGSVETGGASAAAGMLPPAKERPAARAVADASRYI
jgi:hypothetical protein